MRRTLGRRLAVTIGAVIAIVAGFAGSPAASAGSPAGKPGPSGPGGALTNSLYPCIVFQGGTCTTVLTNLNLRAQPHRNSTSLIVMPQGSDFQIRCWGYGDSVNGDNIWYFGQYFTSIDVGPISWPIGWAAGYYLATGADPNPNFVNCADP